LCPSITETLVAIGGRKSLVGATRYCVRPKGMLWGLPRIGGTKSPDIPRILDLTPDLVFANEEENRREDIEDLRGHGIEVDVTFPRAVSDVPAAVRQWGGRLGAASEAEAEGLARRIEEELDAARAGPRPPPFLYAYWIWKDPWMTISDDTYISDLLALAGGINVFGREPARYPAVSPNEALARGADVHFFPSEPYPFRTERHEPETVSLFGRQRRRLFVDGDIYCWHGVRTLEGLAAVRDIRKEMGE
jgi:ABC-type Fe3+-hydroxamate transport system substrate-binding protein